MALLSIREFARRDGCSHTAVQNAIREGHLPTDGGKLDEGLVGSAWRRSNRRAPPASGKLPVVAVRVGETPEQAAERIVTLGAELLNIADAERLKENYLGRLRQLEYDLKAGGVVPADDVARVVGAEYAKVRTRLLAIPAEQAPRLQRLRTVAEVQDALMGVITEALEELSRDTDAAAA